MTAGPFQAVESQRDPQFPDVWYIAYRWYYPNRALPYASEQGDFFHQWILRLKKDNFYAVRLFSILLRMLWDNLLCSPDIILTIPPARATTIHSLYPLRRVAEKAAELGCGQDRSELLIRAKGVPTAIRNPGVRDPQIQANSMCLSAGLPPRTSSVLLIDDVMTSGSTMTGAVQRILSQHSNPNMRIICFAFGKTQRTGSTPFPPVPSFPDPKGDCEELFRPDVFKSVFGVG